MEVLRQEEQDIMDEIMVYGVNRRKELSDEELEHFRKNQELMQAEAELVVRALNARHALWLLDDKGTQCDSVGLSELIAKTQHGFSGIDLVIGGPFGFSPDLKSKVNLLLSLSKLTFTHQMVRLILAEQLYRAFTIIKGEGYHHV
jgi:23S rRNA (pseudouridine1915-N3)-methyltransferase